MFPAPGLRTGILGQFYHTAPFQIKHAQGHVRSIWADHARKTYSMLDGQHCNSTELCSAPHEQHWQTT